MTLPKLFLIGICCLLFMASSGQRVTRKGNGATLPKKEAVEDSVVFYEVEFEAKQKNYLEQMLGGWNVQTMQQQARMKEEVLKNVYLIFNKDATFTGHAGCNRLSGKYSLKGTSIRFSDIITTKMACEALQQETALLKLLSTNVSAYTIEGDQLLLRDGASNILFKATRRAEK